MAGIDIEAPAGSRRQSAFQLPSSSSSSSSPSPRQPLATAETSFPSDAADDDSEDDDAPLPFPTALSRRDFLTPDFDAADYLSSLFPDTSTSDGQNQGLGLGTARHQTLEDLRAELRERSAAISAELLELVNANYTSFLGLGDELKGGEERVEDVRVGLLGFRRQVEEVQGRVAARREEVHRSGADLRGVRGEIETGRGMLELEERLEVLLDCLEKPASDDELDTDEDEDEETTETVAENEAVFTGSSPTILLELAREYRRVDSLANAIGRDSPYVKKTEEKITRCKNTLLLDLGTSMKEARKAREKGQRRVIKLLAVYRLLGATGEAVKILKDK